MLHFCTVLISGIPVVIAAGASTMFMVGSTLTAGVSGGMVAAA